MTTSGTSSILDLRSDFEGETSSCLLFLTVWLSNDVTLPLRLYASGLALLDPASTMSMKSQSDDS